MENNNSSSNSNYRQQQFKSQNNRNKQNYGGGGGSGGNGDQQSSSSTSTAYKKPNKQYSNSNNFRRYESYHQSSNSNNDSGRPSTPPQPVKILAKSNKDQQPPPKPIIIASNNSSSRIVSKSSFGIYGQSSDAELSKHSSGHRNTYPGTFPAAVGTTSSQSNISKTNSSGASSSSTQQVKILDKQFIRLQIASKLPKTSSATSVDSSAAGSSSSTIGTTTSDNKATIKLLDGEFNFQEISKLEKLFLHDGTMIGGSIPVTTATSVLSTTAVSSVVSSSSVSATTSSRQTGSQSFCIVGAVGLDGIGKSSLLNKIASHEVFKTHRSSTSSPSHPSANSNPLSHITNGIDLHITPERVFLLDSQPLLSASILDDFLRHPTSNSNSNNNTSSSNNHISSNNHHHSYSHHHQSQQQQSSSSNSNNNSTLSSVVGFDITEPENFAFIQSLQLLTFMLSICDHLIVLVDSMSLDPYLFKLLSTALMMVGDTVPKANIIIYFRSPTTSKIETGNSPNNNNSESPPPQFDIPKYLPRHSSMSKLLQRSIGAILGPNINIEFIDNESKLITTVLKPPSRNLIVDQTRPISYSSERAWLHSAQRFWDSSVRKSSLFSDYARYLP